MQEKSVNCVQNKYEYTNAINCKQFCCSQITTQGLKRRILTICQGESRVGES